MIKKITLCYFSPTGGTKKVSLKFAAELIKNIKELGNSTPNNIGLSEIDFTKPEVRKKRFEFSDEDILVIASPVYAGRVPNKIAPEFKKAFNGNNTRCVVLCCYGKQELWRSINRTETDYAGKRFSDNGSFSGCISASVF